MSQGWHHSYMKWRSKVAQQPCWLFTQPGLVSLWDKPHEEEGMTPWCVSCFHQHNRGFQDLYFIRCLLVLKLVFSRTQLAKARPSNFISVALRAVALMRTHHHCYCQFSRCLCFLRVVALVVQACSMCTSFVPPNAGAASIKYSGYVSVDNTDLTSLILYVECQ